MKTKNYALCVFAILALVAINCNDEESNYPTDVSFDILSLDWCCTEFGDCLDEWATGTINYDEAVIIIDSNEELMNYFDCPSDICADVDFSKHTLLLVYQRDRRIIQSIVVNSLQRLSMDMYRLDIDLFTWHVSFDCDSVRYVLLVTDKLNKESFIELKVSVDNMDNAIID